MGSNTRRHHRPDSNRDDSNQHRAGRGSRDDAQWDGQPQRGDVRIGRDHRSESLGTRKDATHAYYLAENDSGSATYSHVVRFWGISNCANKVVTVWEAGRTGTRTVTLNSSCVTTTAETWSPRRWRLYKAAVN